MQMKASPAKQTSRITVTTIMSAWATPMSHLTTSGSVPETRDNKAVERQVETNGSNQHADYLALEE